MKKPILETLDWSRLMEDFSSDIERSAKKNTF